MFFRFFQHRFGLLIAFHESNLVSLFGSTDFFVSRVVFFYPCQYVLHSRFRTAFVQYLLYRRHRLEITLSV